MRKLTEQEQKGDTHVDSIPETDQQATGGKNELVSAARVSELVEKLIQDRAKAGKMCSRAEIEMMRSWPQLVTDGEPHPWYGPCDGMGVEGGCSECQRFDPWCVTHAERLPCWACGESDNQPSSERASLSHADDPVDSSAALPESRDSASVEVLRAHS